MVAPRSAARNGGSFPPPPCGRALAADISYGPATIWRRRQSRSAKRARLAPLLPRIRAALEHASSVGGCATYPSRIVSGSGITWRGCADPAQGVLALIIDAAEPGRDHLSGALQVFGNADVDEVAGKKVCAKQFLVHQARKYVLLERDRRLPDGFEDAAREVVDAGIDQARANARLFTKSGNQPLVDLDAAVASRVLDTADPDRAPWLRRPHLPRLSFTQGQEISLKQRISVEQQERIPETVADVEQGAGGAGRNRLGDHLDRN